MSGVPSNAHRSTAGSSVFQTTVKSIGDATASARVWRLRLHGVPFRFAAGQAARLGVPAHGRKPYSIACGPETASRQDHLEFLIGLDASGRPGPHLEGVKRGAVVEVEGPLGTFRFPDHARERHVLFVAGGTGIAPLRAMLQHVLATRPDTRVSVAYSARSARDFAYLDELEDLAANRVIRLGLTVTRENDPLWRGGRGRLSAAALAPLIDDPATLCFVCGPAALVEAVPAQLTELGIARSRIKKEEW